MGDQSSVPGQEDPLEKEMATHSSILPWEIPWTEDQFIVIHTVKGFGIVNKAEIDVFLELTCFFHDHCRSCGRFTLGCQHERDPEPHGAPASRARTSLQMQLIPELHTLSPLCRRTGLLERWMGKKNASLTSFPKWTR